MRLKIKKIKKMRRGITLVELLLAAFLGIIIMLSSGVVLVANQRGWQSIYNYQYGVVSDAHVAKSAFEAAVRKSSIEVREPEVGLDGEYVNLYYYADIYSTHPDKYAMFYTTDDGELKVAYGQLYEDYDEYVKLEPDSVVTLADNVTYSYFNVVGRSVLMALNIDDSSHEIDDSSHEIDDSSHEVIELRCSAVRHAK